MMLPHGLEVQRTAQAVKSPATKTSSPPQDAFQWKFADGATSLWLLKVPCRESAVQVSCQLSADFACSVTSSYPLEPAGATPHGMGMKKAANALLPAMTGSSVFHLATPGDGFHR